MGSVAVAFAVVFLAELGDKTQLVAFSLGARFAPWLVVTGIALAFAVTQGFAALLGGAIGAALPEGVVTFAAALAFFGFAVWVWFDEDDEDDDDVELRSDGKLRVLAGIVLAMTVAEMGDKTMLATATLATDRDPLAVWAGASLGGASSSALGVVAGRWLGQKLPERTTRRVAAVLFAVFGALLLIEALL